MYLRKFGLNHDPFSIAPDPRFLFMSDRHREALAHLLWGVSGQNNSVGSSGGGFVLLTGDIGAGKTTICRCFLQQIPSHCNVGYIFNPKLSVVDLLQSICEEFHIALPKDMGQVLTPKVYIDALNKFLLERHAAWESCVLIIDEAQNLSPRVLEQLRLLTNLETNERKLLQIILIGQPELRTMLAQPELEQLAQRVTARFHLKSLNFHETRQYITHRLSVAGLVGSVPFDGPALQRIYDLTQGVPRRINLLCGRALLGAWANEALQVNRAMINQAAIEVFGEPASSGRRWNSAQLSYIVGALGLITAGILFFKLQGQSLPPAPATALATAVTVVPEKPMDASSVAKPVPMTPASAPPSISVPLHPMDQVLPKLPRDINIAWHELADFWHLPPTNGDPCVTATQHQLRCHQANKLSLPQLRQLDRPGLLTLYPPSSPPVYAVLTGLSEQTVTLQASGQEFAVGWLALGQLWQGEFATYWAPPSGYTAAQGFGNTGPAINILASELALLEGAAPPNPATPAPVLNAELSGRISAFQRAQGLKADGLPGPMTFMHIERARGVISPRLQSASR
jgi:general secretion pathway protein A